MLSRSILARTLQQPRILSAASRRTFLLRRSFLPSQSTAPTYTARCGFQTTSIQRLDQAAVDQKMEEITELYGTARDEFEIALEETEKMTVYAEGDRAAAREELTNLQQAYKEVVEGPDAEMAEEIKRRVGPRIRELENAVAAMEELAQNQD